MLESFRIPINVSLYSRLNLKHSILYRLGYLRHVLLSLKDSGVEGQLIQSQNSLQSSSHGVARLRCCSMSHCMT